MDALASSREPDFHITPEIKARLLAISDRQVDRPLKPAKDAPRIRGISGAKAAAHACGNPRRGHSHRRRGGPSR